MPTRKSARKTWNLFFADKGTHTTDTGAQFNAACVIAGLKTLPGNPIGTIFIRRRQSDPSLCAGRIRNLNQPPQPMNLNSVNPQRRFYIWISAFLLMLLSGVALPAQPSLKFVFGTDPKPGWTTVAPTNFYSGRCPVRFLNRAAQVRATHGFRQRRPAVLFLQPDYRRNYRVTVALGGKAEATTTVKAELRRLMLEKVHTGAGRPWSAAFIVNLRTPQNFRRPARCTSSRASKPPKCGPGTTS